MDEERPVRKPLRGVGGGAGVPMADDGGLFGVVRVFTVIKGHIRNEFER